MESDYVTMTEARELLGVSKDTLRKIVEREGWVPRPNPKDARSDLLPRSNVEALAGRTMRDFWRAQYEALRAAVDAEEAATRQRILSRAAQS